MNEAIETLGLIQSQLNAPKGQTNKFGGYNYRSCEDILEALKPLLKAHQAAVTLSDEVYDINGSTYVKAIASLHANSNTVSSVGWAQEGSLKGMSPSQCTGAASSYARKYALNGLFAIDDSKDADAVNTHGKEEESVKAPVKKPAQKTNRLSKPEPKKETSVNTDDWRNFVVPFGKTNKGKTLGSLQDNSLKWYIDNIDKDGPFRTALDNAKEELFAAEEKERQDAMTPNTVTELPFEEEGDDVPF